MEDDVYIQLARHLDKAIAGAPMSPALIEILKILYPGEEAEVALGGAIYENRTARQWAEALPEKAERLEEILDRMAHRGTVYTEQKPGRERIYRLLPSVVGFAEAPFLSGEDTPEKRALAQLWKDYILGEYGHEMARGLPLIRVVPIAESLEDSSQVLPSDALEEKVGEASFIAVAHCPCRQIGRYVGAGCEHTIADRCMHFGGMGRYIVEMGMGRRIDKEEAMAILRAATEEGLVHVCDNVQGNLHTICNCCPCCCGFFVSRKVHGHETISRSNYVARVEEEVCTGCGTCEDRCPVEAVSVADDVARVDRDLCIGCGVCAPACGGDGAIRLALREDAKPPPDVQEFLAARMKS